jgi:hypothetical protein
VSEHGRLNERAAPLAAGFESCASGNRLVDPGVGTPGGIFGNNGADVRSLVQWLADLQFFHAVEQTRQKARLHVALNENALR